MMPPRSFLNGRYAARFKDVFGQNIFADRTRAFTQAMYAIERFELEDPSFHPCTNKFDYYLDGKVQLTAQDLRRKKRVSARCGPSRISTMSPLSSPR